jgi:hypothetical protein
MKKWIIRAPGMLGGMGDAVFKPGVGLMLLIGLEIFIAYNKVSVLGLIVYGVFFVLGRDFNSADEVVRGLLSSQGILIFSLFIFAVLTALTVIYVTRIEKRPLATLGISRGAIAPRYAAGFGLGAAALLLIYTPVLISSGISYAGFSVLVPVYLLAFIVQSASEEVFFRGFLLTGIAKRIGILYGVLISAAVFSLAHALGGGYSLLGGIYYAMIGAFLALLMLRTNSIWASCGFHAAWNFTIGLLSPMELGGGLAPVDYAVFDTGEVAEGASYGFLGDPYYLVMIGVFIAACAALLFAGSGRLIVRSPQQETGPDEPSPEPAGYWKGS